MQGHSDMRHPEKVVNISRYNTPLLAAPEPQKLFQADHVRRIHALLHALLHFGLCETQFPADDLLLPQVCTSTRAS